MNEHAKPLSEMTQEELWQLFPIILSGYDPDWKEYYEEEKTLLEKSARRPLKTPSGSRRGRYSSPHIFWKRFPSEPD